MRPVEKEIREYKEEIGRKVETVGKKDKSGKVESVLTNIMKGLEDVEGYIEVRNELKRKEDIDKKEYEEYLVRKYSKETRERMGEEKKFDSVDLGLFYLDKFKSR